MLALHRARVVGSLQASFERPRRSDLNHQEYGDTCVDFLHLVEFVITLMWFQIENSRSDSFWAF